MEAPKKSKGPEARWGPKLGKSFTPVSSYFLQNAHRLKPEGMPKAKGLAPSEVMVLIHLISYQWDTKDAWPALGTIAEHMSLSRRQVRDIVKRLEDLKLITRIFSTKGGTSRYSLAPLKARLEAMMELDVEKAEDAAQAAEGEE